MAKVATMPVVEKTPSRGRRTPPRAVRIPVVDKGDIREYVDGVTLVDGVPYKRDADGRLRKYAGDTGYMGGPSAVDPRDGEAPLTRWSERLQRRVVVSDESIRMFLAETRSRRLQKLSSKARTARPGDHIRGVDMPKKHRLDRVSTPDPVDRHPRPCRQARFATADLKKGGK